MTYDLEVKQQKSYLASRKDDSVTALRQQREEVSAY